MRKKYHESKEERKRWEERERRYKEGIRVEEEKEEDERKGKMISPSEGKMGEKVEVKRQRKRERGGEVWVKSEWEI